MPLPEDWGIIGPGAQRICAPPLKQGGMHEFGVAGATAGYGGHRCCWSAGQGAVGGGMTVWL